MSAAAAPPVRRTRIGRLSWVWTPRVAVVAAIVVCLVLAVGAVALSTGTITVPVPDVARAVFGQGEPITVKVVRDLRLPRFVTAALVGASLGISGAVFQSISRNPLGSPDIIGFTMGAATGAVVQIVVFGGGAFATGAAAVAGGVVTAVVVYGLSYRRAASGGYRLILVGIGIGAILKAMNGLLLTRADIDTSIAAQRWLAGSLDVRTWDYVVTVGLAMVLLVPAALWFQRRLAYMEMGDDTARQLGIRVERTRLLAVAVAVVLAAVAVAATGPIAFIALAAAPLAKRLTRHPGPAVGSAALMGALLLTSADALTQFIPWDYAMPVGVVTGLLGGLYLAWMLGRSRI
ncbi:iron chelate uptake ABC transporter family permease subunit [Demequina sp. NBRC 110057]|uniref:FecCD family ABC transporter permease n=1 Tax=Demequina sp. NBRC 110057 TaxID=1570346 RepID=UPI001F1C8536|nr:iron chelate uptake ABC transporter family permease subunit [Demequina sp. NBRC 110057]